jgi:negative regulator of sigma E activity
MTMENEDIKNMLDAAQEEILAEAASRQMRAWNRLQFALYETPEAKPERSLFAWTGGWVLTCGAVAAIIVALAVIQLLPTNYSNLSYAQAQQPDLYTSTFYSSQAQADVVWITGLDAADADEMGGTQ